MKRFIGGRKFSALMAFSGLLLGLAQPLAAKADSLIGKYEVSYMYNVMPDSGPRNPEGVQYYGGVATQPIRIDVEPGEYYLRIVPGRETGNPAFPGYGYLDTFQWLIAANNAGYAYPDTGFAGGTTNPWGDYGIWWRASFVWVGTSTAANAGRVGALGGLDSTYKFTVGKDEKIWLYWPDSGITDNLGGATLELWRQQVERLVTIDVMPGSQENSINPRKSGVIPVALLGTPEFDPQGVDVASVHFGRTGGEATALRSAVEDVNRDGMIDLTLKFSASDTGLDCGDQAAFLTGKSVGGEVFKGFDVVTTVACK